MEFPRKDPTSREIAQSFCGFDSCCNLPPFGKARHSSCSSPGCSWIFFCERELLIAFVSGEAEVNDVDETFGKTSALFLRLGSSFDA